MGTWIVYPRICDGYQGLLNFSMSKFQTILIYIFRKETKNIGNISSRLITKCLNFSNILGFIALSISVWNYAVFLFCFSKRLFLVLSFDNLILLKMQNIFFSRNQNVKWHSCSCLYYVILSYGFFCLFKKCGKLKWFTPLLMAKVCGNILYKDMANCFMTTSEIIFSSRILFRVRLFFAKCMQARTKETFTRGTMFWFFWDAKKLAPF